MSHTAIKVLHVLGAPGIGGIEKLVLDLSKKQAAASSVLCGIMFIRDKSGEFMPYYEALGIPVHSIGLASGMEISCRKWRAARQIFREYDVLHIHTFNPLICSAAAFARKKILYTEHGNFALGRETGLKGAFLSRLKSWFLKGFVDSISYNSEFSRQKAAQLYRLGEADGRVIYNGIDLDSQKPVPGEQLEELVARLSGNFVVGTSSRFAAFKRVDRLIQGFAEFQKGKDAVLLLVGDGSCREELELLVDDLGIRDKVLFTGYQVNVQAYQALMDVSVLASSGEPFGLVAVEYLALGKVVLVFADGGGLLEVVGGYSPDYIVDGVVGLTQKLDALYENRAAIADGAESRVAYARRFDVEVMEREFECEYRKLTACAE